MLLEYVREFYLPAADDYAQRCANGAALAQSLWRWERQIHHRWREVHTGHLEVAPGDDGLAALRALAMLWWCCPWGCSLWRLGSAWRSLLQCSNRREAVLSLVLDSFQNACTRGSQRGQESRQLRGQESN